MAGKKIIDIEKIDSAQEKVAANPDLLKPISAAWSGFFKNLGIELNTYEQHYLLNEIQKTSKSRTSGGVCGGICW